MLAAKGRPLVPLARDRQGLPRCEPGGSFELRGLRVEGHPRHWKTGVLERGSEGSSGLRVAFAQVPGGKLLPQIFGHRSQVGHHSPEGLRARFESSGLRFKHGGGLGVSHLPKLRGVRSQVGGAFFVGQKPLDVVFHVVRDPLVPEVFGGNLRGLGLARCPYPDREHRAHAQEGHCRVFHRSCSIIPKRALGSSSRVPASLICWIW